MIANQANVDYSFNSFSPPPAPRLRVVPTSPIEGEGNKFCFNGSSAVIMKKLQPADEVVKIDEDLGIAWILLPPDELLGGFRGISPRIMDEEKFMAAKKKSEEKKD